MTLREIETRLSVAIAAPQGLTAGAGVFYGTQGGIGEDDPGLAVLRALHSEAGDDGARDGGDGDVGQRPFLTQVKEHGLGSAVGHGSPDRVGKLNEEISHERISLGFHRNSRIGY